MQQIPKIGVSNWFGSSVGPSSSQPSVLGRYCVCVCARVRVCVCLGLHRDASRLVARWLLHLQALPPHSRREEVGRARTFITKAKVFLQTLTLLFLGQNCVMWPLLAAKESDKARIFSEVH